MLPDTRDYTSGTIHSASIPRSISHLVVLWRSLLVYHRRRPPPDRIRHHHYRASTGKLLSLSRGNPLFSFGPIDAPVTYDKKDILEVVIYGGYKGFDGLKRTEIVFKDGSAINISGMILPPYSMSLKFPQQNVSRKLRSFPFIPLSASAPS